MYGRLLLHELAGLRHIFHKIMMKILRHYFGSSQKLRETIYFRQHSLWIILFSFFGVEASSSCVDFVAKYIFNLWVFNYSRSSCAPHIEASSSSSPISISSSLTGAPPVLDENKLCAGGNGERLRNDFSSSGRIVNMSELCGNTAIDTYWVLLLLLSEAGSCVASIGRKEKRNHHQRFSVWKFNAYGARDGNRDMFSTRTKTFLRHISHIIIIIYLCGQNYPIIHGIPACSLHFTSG